MPHWRQAPSLYLGLAYAERNESVLVGEIKNRVDTTACRIWRSNSRPGQGTCAGRELVVEVVIMFRN
jgi:hypothetical protein